MSTKRGEMRLLAVQILYQYEFYKSEVSPQSLTSDTIESFDILSKQVLTDELQETFDSLGDPEFLEQIINGTIDTMDEIDMEIAKYLKEGYTIASLLPVLRCILRIGVYEMLAIKSIPPEVIISEYIRTCDMFYGIKQTTFVNAILDKVARNLRPEYRQNREQQTNSSIIEETVNAN